jgi:hypothetical protein
MKLPPIAPANELPSAIKTMIRKNTIFFRSIIKITLCLYHFNKSGMAFGSKRG